MHFFSLLLLLGSKVFFSSSEKTYTLDYAVYPGESGIILNDIKTDIPNIVTPFTYELFAVVAKIGWTSMDPISTSGVLEWATKVDGKEVERGEYTLGSSSQLPRTLSVGTASFASSGRHTVEVTLKIDDTVIILEENYVSYPAGVSIIPLVVIVGLAMILKMVEVSMGFGVFLGACMVTGNIKYGFIRALNVYILEALSSSDHGYVYLFTFFLASVVALMEKSGGLQGFANLLSIFAKSARTGQLVAFCGGLCLFFDDYANTLVIGSMFRDITDSLSVSCEKLAFIVDGTAAPIASLTPISSWIGFEIGLIQTELDKLVAKNDGMPLEGLPTSGMEVFIQSIKYRYYPFFLLMLVPMIILSGREWGPMLVAERKVRIFGRTDGGEGSTNEPGLEESAINPEPDVPRKWWNMVIPLLTLVFLIIYLLIMTGSDGSGTQSIDDMIQNADSYLSLLLATFATAMVMLLLYSIQFIHEGEIVPPLPKYVIGYIKALCSKPETEKEMEIIKSAPKPLMTLGQFVHTFIFGMRRVFEALIILTLAWCVGAVMEDVGANRLFAIWIIDSGIPAALLPTLSFIISMFMALATGTSWGTMTIMFPLIIGPSWTASNGDLQILYSVVASILSGAVLGDHVSPISDTTVLSSLASGCKLMNHVITQAPYAAVPGFFAIIWGTLPVGYKAYPNGVGILLGLVSEAFLVAFFAAPVINPTGRFDLLTELMLKFNKSSPLHELKEETVKAYASLQAGEDFKVDDAIGKKLDFDKIDVIQDVEVETVVD